jgi:hypothetical protein
MGPVSTSRKAESRKAFRLAFLVEGRKVESQKQLFDFSTLRLFGSSTSSQVLDDLLAELRALHLGRAFHQAMAHEIQANDRSQAG